MLDDDTYEFLQDQNKENDKNIESKNEDKSIPHFDEKYRVSDIIDEFNENKIFDRINDIFKMGATKYGPFAWEKQMTREASSTELCCQDAVIRHLLMVLTGNFIDYESNKPHMDHVLCRSSMMAVQSLRYNYNLYNDEENLLGINDICILPDTKHAYISPLIFITLSKYRKLDIKHIHAYKTRLLDACSDKTKLQIATARYLLSIIEECSLNKNNPYVNDIYNELTISESLFLNIAKIISLMNEVI